MGLDVPVSVEVGVCEGVNVLVLVRVTVPVRVWLLEPVEEGVSVDI